MISKSSNGKNYHTSVQWQFFIRETKNPEPTDVGCPRHPLLLVTRNKWPSLTSFLLTVLPRLAITVRTFYPRTTLLRVPQARPPWGCVLPFASNYLPLYRSPSLPLHFQEPWENIHYHFPAQVTLYSATFPNPKWPLHTLHFLKTEPWGPSLLLSSLSYTSHITSISKSCPKSLPFLHLQHPNLLTKFLFNF